MPLHFCQTYPCQICNPTYFRKASAAFPPRQVPEYFQCFCRGGPDCCVKRAERDREQGIRKDERDRVLEELRRLGYTR